MPALSAARQSQRLFAPIYHKLTLALTGPVIGDSRTAAQSTDFADEGRSRNLKEPFGSHGSSICDDLRHLRKDRLCFNGPMKPAV
jgi:hypothetical protein